MVYNNKYKYILKATLTRFQVEEIAERKDEVVLMLPIGAPTWVARGVCTIQQQNLVTYAFIFFFHKIKTLSNQIENSVCALMPHIIMQVLQDPSVCTGLGV